MWRTRVWIHLEKACGTLLQFTCGTHPCEVRVGAPACVGFAQHERDVSRFDKRE